VAQQPHQAAAGDESREALATTVHDDPLSRDGRRRPRSWCLERSASKRH
jgi:hypothetical protein